LPYCAQADHATDVLVHRQYRHAEREEQRTSPLARIGVHQTASRRHTGSRPMPGDWKSEAGGR
jgi:hypothetical protein